MKQLRKRNTLLILAGGVATLLAAPLLVPMPPLKGTYPPHELADDDSEFVEIEGLDIHIKQSGRGEPVFVLLHGFATSLYTWQTVMEPFSHLGRVIAFDRPGFGLSAHPLNWQGRNPYSSDTQVKLVIGLLDHYGVDRAILVGNSAGGAVSIQTALAHPKRVSALVLVDPMVYHAGGAPSWIHWLLATPQMRRMGPLATRQIVAHGRDVIRMAWYNPALMSEEVVKNYLKPYKVENWDKALWEFTLAHQDSGFVKQLDEITQPVLVVTGDDDRIVPARDSVRLANALPNARLELIKNAGHVPHEEQPEAFMNVVTDFVTNLQS